MDKELNEKNTETAKLKGCYLLIILSSPKTKEDKEEIIQNVAKDLLSWNTIKTNCDLKELENFWNELSNKQEVEKNESDMLMQYSNAQMAIEILYNPQLYTVKQCLRNLFQSFTAHKQIIYSGYTYSGTGNWILNDNIFCTLDFIEQLNKSNSPLLNLSKNRSPDFKHTIHLHCKNIGEWKKLEKQLNKTESCYSFKLNPSSSDGVPGAADLIDFLQENLKIQKADELECSEIVGNIRFTRPTLYVIPSGQGDSVVIGINGFTMLIDGGFNASPNSWSFVKHLEKIDSILITRFNENNCLGLETLFNKLCSKDCSAPKIGRILGNMPNINKIASTNQKINKTETDRLEINLIQSGQNLVEKINKAGLLLPKPLIRPQDAQKQFEAIELYHRIGFGTLNLYILNPLEDSKFLREYLTQFNEQNRELFSSVRMQTSGSANNLLKNLQPIPLSNLTSIALVIAWLPAELDEKIVRLFLPGSTPTLKLMEVLSKLQTKHPNTELSILLNNEFLTKSEFDKLLSAAKPKQAKVSATNYLKSSTENESLNQSLKGRLKPSQRNRSMSPAVRMQQEKSTPQFYDSLETLTPLKQANKNLSASINKKLVQAKSSNADKNLEAAKKLKMNSSKPIGKLSTINKSNVAKQTNQTSVKADTQQANNIKAKGTQASDKKSVAQENKAKKPKSFGISNSDFTSSRKIKNLGAMSEASSSVSNLTSTNTIKAFLRDEYEADSLEFLNSAQSTTLSKDSLDVGSESGGLNKKIKDDDEDSLNETEIKSYSAADTTERNLWDIAKRKDSEKELSYSPVEKERYDAYSSDVDDNFVKQSIADNMIMNQSTLSTSTIIDNSLVAKSNIESDFVHVDNLENADSDQEYREEDAEVQKIFESEKGLKRKILVLENNIAKEENLDKINDIAETRSELNSLSEGNFKPFEKINIESIAVINKMEIENEFNQSAITTKNSSKQLDKSLIVGDINNNNSYSSEKLIEKQVKDDEQKEIIINSNANVPDSPKNVQSVDDKFVVNKENFKEVPTKNDENVIRNEDFSKDDKKLDQSFDLKTEDKDLISESAEKEDKNLSIESNDEKNIEKNLPEEMKNESVTISITKPADETKNLSRKSSEVISISPNELKLESKIRPDENDKAVPEIKKEIEEEIVIPKQDKTRTGTPTNDLDGEKETSKQNNKISENENLDSEKKITHSDMKPDIEESEAFKKSISSSEDEKISEKLDSSLSSKTDSIARYSELDESQIVNKLASEKELSAAQSNMSDKYEFIHRQESDGKISPRISDSDSQTNEIENEKIRKSSVKSDKSLDAKEDPITRSYEEIDKDEPSKISQSDEKKSPKENEFSKKGEFSNAQLKSSGENFDLVQINTSEKNISDKDDENSEKIDLGNLVHNKEDDSENLSDDKNTQKIESENNEEIFKISNENDEFLEEPERVSVDEEDCLKDDSSITETEMQVNERRKLSKIEDKKSIVLNPSEESDAKDDRKSSVDSLNKIEETKIVEERISDINSIRNRKLSQISDRKSSLTSLKEEPIIEKLDNDASNENCPAKDANIENKKVVKMDESQTDHKIDLETEPITDNSSKQKAPASIRGDEIEESSKKSIQEEEVSSQPLSPEKLGIDIRRESCQNGISIQTDSNEKNEKDINLPADLQSSKKESLEGSSKMLESESKEKSEKLVTKLVEDSSSALLQNISGDNSQQNNISDSKTGEPTRKSSVKSLSTITSESSELVDQSIAQCKNSEEQELNKEEDDLHESHTKAFPSKLSSIEAKLTEQLTKRGDEALKKVSAPTEPEESIQTIASELVRTVINESILASEKLSHQISSDDESVSQEENKKIISGEEGTNNLNKLPSVDLKEPIDRKIPQEIVCIDSTEKPELNSKSVEINSLGQILLPIEIEAKETKKSEAKQHLIQQTDIPDEINETKINTIGENSYKESLSPEKEEVGKNQKSFKTLSKLSQSDISNEKISEDDNFSIRSSEVDSTPIIQQSQQKTEEEISKDKMDSPREVSVEIVKNDNSEKSQAHELLIVKPDEKNKDQDSQIVKADKEIINISLNKNEEIENLLEINQTGTVSRQSAELETIEKNPKDLTEELSIIVKKETINDIKNDLKNSSKSDEKLSILNDNCEDQNQKFGKINESMIVDTLEKNAETQLGESVKKQKDFENLVEKESNNVDIDAQQTSEKIKQEKSFEDKKEAKSNFGVGVQSASDAVCQESIKSNESKASEVDQPSLDSVSLKQIEDYSKELIEKANEFVLNLEDHNKVLEIDLTEESESNKSERSDSGFEFITNISGVERRHSHSTSNQHQIHNEDNLIRRASESISYSAGTIVSTLNTKDESSNQSSRNSLIEASLIGMATLNSAIVTKRSLTPDNESDIFELMNEREIKKRVSEQKDEKQEQTGKESSSEDSEYEKIDIKEIQSILGFEKKEDTERSRNLESELTPKETSRNLSTDITTESQSTVMTQSDTTQIPCLSVTSTAVSDSKNSIEQKQQETAEKEVSSWSKPLGLPSPSSSKKIAEQLVLTWKPLNRPSPLETPIDDKNASKTLKQATSTSMSKASVTSASNNRQISASTLNNSLNDQQMLTANIVNDSTINTLKPFYFDLIYVPHHGEQAYNHLEFFQKCRTTNYVLSGCNPSRETLDSILEARRQFNNEARKKDKQYTPEIINIIPTHESESLFYWISDRQKELEQEAIEVTPSASRCTVQIQGHESEVCSAYRIQF